MGTPCFLVEKVNRRTVHQDCDEGCPGHDDEVYDAVRADTGEVLATGIVFMAEGQVPVGAMWWSGLPEGPRPTGPDDWDHPDLRKPAEDAKRSPSHTFDDGPHLIVMTPGGQWNIDSRASNCTLPYDYEHRCWVRHGEPPNITVDKQGLTCTAGAGSIQCGDYHGFLVAGALS
jgi:hypothetical protein